MSDNLTRPRGYYAIPSEEPSDPPDGEVFILGRVVVCVVPWKSFINLGDVYEIGDRFTVSAYLASHNYVQFEEQEESSYGWLNAARFLPLTKIWLKQ